MSMSITDPEQIAVTPDADADSSAVPLRGRFKLTPVEPSGAIIGWTTDLCDRCLDCGCGTKRPVIDVTPGGAMRTFRMLNAWFKTGALPGE